MQVVAIVRKMAESDILCVGAEVTVHTRKRKRNPANWTRNVKRKNKALGLEYTRSDGSLAPSRKTGQPCNCRKKCFTCFSDTEKQQIIDDFNGLGRKESQDSHLFGLVSQRPCERHRSRSSTKARNFSYTYKVCLYCKHIDTCYYMIYLLR